MKKLTIDTKYTKTYKTAANLEKALEKMNLPEELMYLQVEVDGRFTAVFTNTMQVPGMTCHIAHNGFKVVG
jgi:cytochrome oxidase assembly protein ShyY1